MSLTPEKKRQAAEAAKEVTDAFDLSEGQKILFEVLCGFVSPTCMALQIGTSDGIVVLEAVQEFIRKCEEIVDHDYNF